MGNDDTRQDDADLRSEREAARIRQDAERMASRELADAERRASREQADAERRASRRQADVERTEARRRRGPTPIRSAGLREPSDHSQVMFDGDHTYYISGQVPVTREGDLAGEDMQTQSHQVMKNLVSALEAARLDAGAVVKLTVFITDRTHAATFSEVRREYFTAPFPASSMVVVASLLDERWKVEVEAVAVEG